MLAREAPELSVTVVDTLQNRIFDNSGVAIASLNRKPVVTARGQVLSLSSSKNGRGSTLFGLVGTVRISPEWAEWANGLAVRELDFHNTFLAADYSHPGDNIPAILAVAQHLKISGARLARAIAVA